ncbi:MAG: DUF4445 domain-containing protein [Clostridia bacterium]|nr:DUF4445 domain-containing protein [Clostridia bacterium]
MSDQARIAVTVDGIPREEEAGILLSELLSREKPCGGHGKCGKCKVMASGALSPLSESEKRLLSSAEIEQGVRLSCCTYAEGDCQVTHINKKRNADEDRIVSNSTLTQTVCNPIFTQYGAAIDIGTTTLAARLYDTEGKLLSEATALNPQSAWGADVISRIEASLGGQASALAGSIRQAIDDLVTKLCHMANLSPEKLDSLVITGNTVMLYLLTESSPLSLSRAPFEADRLFGEFMTAGDLSLTALATDAQVYLPPCISAFVGADTTCALLSTQLCESKRTLMLADIGTNGEMAICHGGRLTVCSTAAGPAFEGVGISMGMRAAVGAIDNVTADKGTLIIHTVGDADPRGICGSGLIDAVAGLLEIEELDESGYLEEDPYPLAPPVTLTGKDIRMVQLAKSAICAGIETLLDRHKIDAEDVATLFVAGGFGSYLNPESARKTGLLPVALASVIKAVGNAALAGASMLLLNRDLQQKCLDMARNAEITDLSTSPVFSESYMMGMIFEEK